MKIPGQSEEISKELKLLALKVRAECSKNILIQLGPSDGDFEGRAEWNDDKIIIELKPGLNSFLAEYIVAHELGHVIQYMRGYAIAGGRIDDPVASSIAGHISDFVFDSMADSIANGNGFPIAQGFDQYYQSSGVLGVIKNPDDCRHFGTDWERLWKYLREARYCRVLQNKLPKVPREYRTLMGALDFANIIKRASNLDLKFGLEVKNAISKQRIVSRVIEDLLRIDKKNKTQDVECCVSELKAIFDYFNLQPGNIQITKPLTGENLVDGHWQQIQKNKNSSILEELFKSVKFH